MNTGRPLAAVWILVATACVSNDSASTDTASISNTANVVPSERRGEPSAADFSNYRLDMEKMRKYSRAMQQFSMVAASDSTAAEALSSHPDKTVAEAVATLERSPTARKILSDAGLTATDYVWISVAWLQAAGTRAMLDANKSAKLPTGQNPQNSDFIKAHRAELEAMMKDSVIPATTGH